MNDPMEGFYTADPDIPVESLDALKVEQKNLKFCSLSKYHNSPLMWAHYANGNRGIAIGIEVKDDADLREVIFGERADRTQKALLKNIVRKINPKIEIIEWTDDMFYLHSDPVRKR